MILLYIRNNMSVTGVVAKLLLGLSFSAAWVGVWLMILGDVPTCFP